ncbi:hypothetical protein DICPUDRAFT_89486 [Dictyostelium purpureum]|uniref:Uncharacterized protein n=1 Tax=Dictyostelium purpureum TaxID=5786 RepID=F0ZW63_DICPU|nr:uncharacterized protein DICPUDRAFT_89486 [Dictyostelium purpureum]EGC31814.1 hypothetical protein DICPUDRAFT_89486 [Dictyostelium purpureum]|eukprot:XP_003291648.1 hypothetical protein DICPUDRAFT_89486 [Dictyostelium purpureum]
MKKVSQQPQQPQQQKQQQQQQQQNKGDDNRLEEIYLRKEEIKEDIIIDKRKIIDLDQRNNLNFEALDNITTNKNGTSNKNGKLWIYTGDIFIQMKEASAKELIIQENDTIENEIMKLRLGLDDKEKQLKQLEKDYELERSKIFS